MHTVPASSYKRSRIWSTGSDNYVRGDSRSSPLRLIGVAVGKIINRPAATESNHTPPLARITCSFVHEIGYRNARSVGRMCASFLCFKLGRVFFLGRGFLKGFASCFWMISDFAEGLGIDVCASCVVLFRCVFFLRLFC